MNEGDRTWETAARIWYSGALEVLQPLRWHIEELIQEMESYNRFAVRMNKLRPDNPTTVLPVRKIEAAKEAQKIANDFFSGKSTMKPSDFCTSRVFVINDLTYVVIAEHCTKITPNWAPERESAFALNTLLKSIFGFQLCECQEGVFETRLEAAELEQLLRQHGFVHNPILEEIANDFIAEYDV